MGVWVLGSVEIAVFVCGCGCVCVGGVCVCVCVCVNIKWKPEKLVRLKQREMWMICLFFRP